MDRQERGEKSNRLGFRAVLDRLRAEHRIRKIRRWVRKVVEFVPNKVLGWLKTVRTCFNLKFRKGPEDPSGDSNEQGLHAGLNVRGEAAKLVMELPPTAPYPNWWAWHRIVEGRTPNGEPNIAVYRGKTPDDSHLSSIPSPFGVPTGAGWELPEAIKPENRLEEVIGEGHFGDHEVWFERAQKVRRQPPPAFTSFASMGIRFRGREVFWRSPGGTEYAASAEVFHQFWGTEYTYEMRDSLPQF